MTLVKPQTKIQSLEKGSLLGVATLLVSTGVAFLDKQPVVGIILVAFGVGLYLVREFRK
jgi:4-amino-4-deoxy-L-arabinose transferase-like glycosyltransferase